MDNDNTTKKAQPKKERRSAVELENRINRAAELLEEYMTIYEEEPAKEIRVAHGVLMGKDELEILREMVGLSDPVG